MEVRPGPGAGARKIVVGLGNDNAARGALRWASEAASASGALLVIITAYSFPRPAVSFEGAVYACIDDARAAAQFTQDRAIRRVLSGCATRVARLVVRGDPAAMLVEASATADLLVVGRRSSRWRRLLTGSVSKDCLARAACPVVVVREAPVDRRPNRAFVARTELGCAPRDRCFDAGGECGRSGAPRSRRLEVARELRRTGRGGVADT